jgi:hypothetical protein
MGNAFGKYVAAGGSRDVCARKHDSPGVGFTGPRYFARLNLPRFNTAVDSMDELIHANAQICQLLLRLLFEARLSPADAQAREQLRRRPAVRRQA